MPSLLSLEPAAGGRLNNPNGRLPNVPLIPGAENFSVAGKVARAALPSEFDPSRANVNAPVGRPAPAGATVACSVRVPGSCRDPLLLVSVVVVAGSCPCAAAVRRRSSTTQPSRFIAQLPSPQRTPDSPPGRWG